MPGKKTPVSNLGRHIPSHTLFARTCVKGKLIRRSPKSKVLSVASLRLADLEIAEEPMTRHTLAIHRTGCSEIMQLKAVHAGIDFCSPRRVWMNRF
jgi:hypothetical protein